MTFPRCVLMPRAEGEQPTTLQVVDLGRIAYADALGIQRKTLDRILDDREGGSSVGGVLYLLEHDPPVITLSRRAQGGAHLLVTQDQLRTQGVELHETDRGGDITYHGPGQLVVYPIIDLARLKLNLHAYMRLLEQVVVDLCTDLGLHPARDPSATGVWLTDGDSGVENGKKVCAIGIRVRRWVSMHGLALNITTNLDHFDLIVPCGLAGRSVTTLAGELGAEHTPSMDVVKRDLAERFAFALGLDLIPGSDRLGHRL